MPKPRLPQGKAELTGANLINKGRFEGRASPLVKSLGPAPKGWPKEMKSIWAEFKDEFPWLGRSDRKLVKMAVQLQHKIDYESDCPIGVFAQLRLILSSMGGTPADRTKIYAPEEPEETEEDQFFN